MAEVSLSASTARSERLLGVDLLRFVAATAVMIYHFLYAGPISGAYWGVPTFVPGAVGWLGVDVFFIISGLVISFSIEGRKPLGFAKARFLRLYPALLVTSIIGTLLWLLLDGGAAFHLRRWLAEMTLFPEAFGYNYRLSIYWTLAVEVTFYLGVLLLMWAGFWRTRKVAIMVIWLSLSLMNEFAFHNQILSKLLITEYAGHFCAGICLYLWIKGERSPAIPFILALSWITCFQYEVGYFYWMAENFSTQFDPVYIAIVPPALLGLVYWFTRMEITPAHADFAILMGAASYPLYLIHSDVGFWPRAFLDRVLIPMFPWVGSILQPVVLMGLALLGSLVLSIAFAKWIEPPTRSALQQLVRGRRTRIKAAV